ncbi:anaerobic magnesium-protoporphyrin IX monomethyl ester cyclase [Carboxydocella sporoproducens DSM 16521]|uniref:Anaerobic magnesium-protoporphyrin IX monomethyl ester cyclase n=2 Tax=Carboxydocella TaxID=178898 RepID=A0A1T4MKQ8_9FIRM|nr:MULTISPECIES: radical SAM protein [Carboxydocella]AVX21376.1 anaerobic magnesium-protoporphyrin IX monomethyl ester cyclase [Carboxydocella thermautotrophica]SJZ67680.1 anaerobic magnesium-protoporphyrin IX monomethyl ester cyclase [Carboxydocella sporoproducens DSM 16521]
MLDLVLVTPDYHCGVVESAGSWLNCGFVYIAGELRRHGVRVQIYDAMTKRHSVRRIGQELAARQPKAVASTAYTSTFPAAAALLKQVKKLIPNCVTIIGGVHPTFMWEEVLTDCPWIDVVVRGEGEEVLPRLMAVLNSREKWQEIAGLAFRATSGQIVTTGQAPFIQDLDRIEGAWDLVEWQDYTYYIFPGSRLGVISTSRGCQHNCSFCSQQKYWQQKWRGRSAEAVCREIELLATRYGVNVLLIADEYPTADRQRWEAILDWLCWRKLDLKLLLETRVDDVVRDRDLMAKYRQAGIVHIYVGVESTEQERLDLFQKGIQLNQSMEALEIINSHDIVSETSFVLGTAEETPESIARTLELAKIYNPDFAHFLLLAPWPYADIYNQLVPYIETEDYAKYNLVEPVMRSRTMSRNELMDAVLACYKEFYFHKLGQWAQLPAGFKRDYLFRSMRVILKNSFITQHVNKLGGMPQKIKELLSKTGVV